MESPLEVLSRAATCMQEHDAVEISKLPAKKLYTRLNSHQNAMNNHQQQQPSSISIIPINLPHSTTTNSPGMVHKDDEPMDQDDDEEINVHDDDSPLDMRITKQHDSDSDSVVRPSVIRRAPSFKETSNSPSGNDPTSSTCDPFIDEHFRRSLGTDYELIMRNKMEQEQQQLLAKQRMIEEQQQQQQLLLVQQQQAQQQQQQQQQQAQVQVQEQHLNKLKHHKKHQIHQHHQAMLAAQHSQAAAALATPPSTPSPPIIVAQIPPPSQQQQPLPVDLAPQAPPPLKKQVIITETHDDDQGTNDMSVDDHFAKALGDTWKKIQKESK